MKLRTPGTKWVAAIAIIVILGLSGTALVARLLAPTPTDIASLVPATATSSLILPLAPGTLSSREVKDLVPGSLRETGLTSWNSLTSNLVDMAFSLGVRKYPIFPAGESWNGQSVAVSVIPGSGSEAALGIWETTDAAPALSYVQTLTGSESKSASSYDGVVVTTVGGEGGFSYALIHSTVYFGSDPHAVEAGILVAQGKARSLAASSDPAELAVLGSGDPIVVYLADTPLSRYELHAAYGPLVIGLRTSGTALIADGATSLREALPSLSSRTISLLAGHLPADVDSAFLAPGGTAPSVLSTLLVANPFLAAVESALPREDAVAAAETGGETGVTLLLVDSRSDAPLIASAWTRWVKAQGVASVPAFASVPGSPFQFRAGKSIDGEQPCYDVHSSFTAIGSTCAALSSVRWSGHAFPLPIPDNQASTAYCAGMRAGVVGEALALVIPGEVGIFRTQIAAISNATYAVEGSSRGETFTYTAYGAAGSPDTVTDS